MIVDKSYGKKNRINKYARSVFNFILNCEKCVEREVLQKNEKIIAPREFSQCNLNSIHIIVMLK